MSVGELCNRNVVIVRKGDSILQAARLMRQHHVGDLVVVEGHDGPQIPVGIVTDRDIVVEVVAKDIDLGAVSVGDVMSFDLVTVMEDENLFEVIELMRSKGVRRVPVVDKEGALVGILAVDDVIDLLAEALWDVAGLIMQEQKREQRTRLSPGAA